jgi:hypothetical protein
MRWLHSLAIVVALLVCPTHSGGAERIRLAQAVTDDGAWELVRDSADARVLERFLIQFPDSAHRQEARDKLDALGDEGEAIAPPVETSAPRPPASRDYALAVQRELKRVGCYAGGLDGAWGPGSRRALQKFADAVGIRLGSEPTGEVLAAVQAKSGSVCGSRSAEEPKVGGTPVSTDLAGNWKSVMTCANRSMTGVYRFSSADRSGVVGSFHRDNSQSVSATISGGGVRGDRFEFMVTFYLLGKRNDESWVGQVSPDGRTISGRAEGFWMDDCRFVLRR